LAANQKTGPNRNELQNADVGQRVGGPHRNDSFLPNKGKKSLMAQLPFAIRARSRTAREKSILAPYQTDTRPKHLIRP
jgi:hypothetical protein